MMMIEIAATALLLLQPAAAQKPAPPKPAPASKPAATDIAVTVNYKGKGTVDAGHKVIVWLFSDVANLTSASRPLATQFVTKNGETVVFKNAPATPVYVFAVYDDKGGYDGISSPPPHGLPSALYRKGPKTPPLAVKAGGPAIKFTFDDSERWNK
jgi:hypothetical protein